MIIVKNNITSKEIVKRVRKIDDFLLVLKKLNSAIYFKKESRIFKLSYEEIIRTLLLERKLFISEFSSNSLYYRNVDINLDSSSKYKIVNNKLISNENHNENEVLLEVLENNNKELISESINYQQKFGKVYINKIIRKNYTREEIDLLLNKLKTINHKTLGNKDLPKITEDEKKLNITYRTRFGFVDIDYIKETNTVISYAESSHTNNNDAFYFNKGVVNNVFIEMRTVVVEKKIKKRNIYIGIFGIAVFITFLSLTFTYIFDYQEITGAFSILGRSWDTPWPYLFFVDYIINTFIFMIVGILVSRAYTKKWSFKSLSNWFVASNFRWIILQITGFHFLATLSWVYIIRKRTSIRTGRLVGNMASLALVATGLQLLSALIFLPYGLFYIQTLDWSFVGVVVNGQTVLLALTIMSFLGVIFWIIGNSYMIVFVYWKPAQNLAFRFIIYISSISKKTDYFVRTEQMDIRILQIRYASRWRLKDKVFLTRTFMVWLLLLLTEMFSMIYTINLFRPTDVNTVQGLTSAVPVVMDIYNLSALSQLIRYTNEAIWLPGGIGMVELFASNAYASYMNTNFVSYFDSLNSLSNYVNDAGVQSALIQRFFNYYFPFIFRSCLCVIVLITIGYKRHIKKSK